MDEKRLALVGAHPDDCDILGSGLAMEYRARGWPVLFVSLANGDCGHHEMPRAALAARRRREADAVAARLGIEYRILNTPDCEVLPTLAQRAALVRVLRGFAPDLVVTHCAEDYHPDHRYTSQLVGDASFLLRVPHYCPEAPALRKPTVHAFFHAFRLPERAPGFAVALDTDAVWARKVELMSLHESQMFEWLPWVEGKPLEEVPPASDAAGRLAYVDRWRRPAFERIAELYREALVARYGAARGRAVKTAEAYVTAPFPSPLDECNARELFPSAG